MSDQNNVQPKDDAVYGLCLWTDGGARPNPGFAGWGLHGYLYRLDAPKKGSGNPDHVLTEYGYQLKSEAENPPVTPINYIDGHGSFGDAATNNVAELSAAFNGLRYAFEHHVQVVRIYTDSEYVRKGMNDWVPGWKRYGWKRSTGEPITNVEDWRRLDEECEKLRARGVTVEFNWVRGHSDILGNMLADRKATLGVMYSRDRKLITQIDSTTADGYWKNDVERHPFIGHRRMYFNTRREHMVPGEYYLGEHGKDDDMLGKRMSDGAFSLVRLKNPDQVVERVMEYQSELADGTDNLMVLQLDQLYRPAVYQEVFEHGKYALDKQKPYRLDLYGLNDEPITRELRPPKLAYRAVECIGFLGEKLSQFQNQDESLAITDLTPILYETIVKTGKKETSVKMELKAEYRVGFAALEVMANYKDAASGELCQESIILTLGIDLLDRNRLKALEGKNPKVSLITWMESEFSFRHATVIEVDDAIGIWAGMYSNIRCLKPVVQS
jgi:ribonuclease HI